MSRPFFLPINCLLALASSFVLVRILPTVFGFGGEGINNVEF
jgi:hypothetical protein